MQLHAGAGREFVGFRQAVAEDEGVVGGLDQQGGNADAAQVVAAGGTAVVVLGIAEAVQGGGDAAVEVPEGAQAVQ
ncbi:hypothetical protein FQZ97_797240 [compost metagenome]